MRYCNPAQSLGAMPVGAPCTGVKPFHAVHLCYKSHGCGTQGKAEVLALAKRMLRRKDKESIVDAAYNRYAFHDTGLPRWFAEDERRFMRWVACSVGPCRLPSAVYCASPQVKEAKRCHAVGSRALLVIPVRCAALNIPSVRGGKRRAVARAVVAESHVACLRVSRVGQRSSAQSCDAACFG